MSASARDVGRAVNAVVGGGIAGRILETVPIGGIGARDLRGLLSDLGNATLDVQLQALVRRGSLQLTLGRYTRPDLPRPGTLPVNKRVIAEQVVAANKEKVAAGKRAYVAANKEKVAAGQRAWRMANPDYQRKHYHANRERLKQQAARKGKTGS